LLLGVVDFQEFLSMIPLTMSGSTEFKSLTVSSMSFLGDLKDRLNLAFSMYDTNEDGLLDKKEIGESLSLAGKIHH
jgi:Ca2+-binding EF-hand superfamily protein